jgi:hypothetical protein
MGAVADFAKNTYLSLPVELTAAAKTKTGKSRVSVAVRSYKNLNYMDTANGSEMKAKGALGTLWTTDFDKDAPEPPPGFLKDYSFMAVFSGQGSPEEISFVLKLVAHYAAKQQKPFAPSIEIGAQLQDYCTQFIGLDCLGFCANCANSVVGTSKYRKNSQTSYGMFVGPTNKLHKLTEVDVTPHMALVYSTSAEVEITKADKTKETKSVVVPGSHAVLTDGLAVATGVNRRRINVVESLGEGSKTGLQFSEFEIRGDANGDLFPVTRLSPFKDDRNVFIVRLTK